ncbi:c-type cytochrome [Sphingosinicella rhizophila]|uniref:Cytochrome c family protein n=1 Tax=Sphingosinicella rhizophila TaxID=3050082 RepID=A0ABU3Q6Y8_9SPHN|nr:cytochrome c family protein [Sphingosinicella sp. GR2756]MDT9599161.1 cytochrome c family protein [Sphingosinicella sp. GR2756]
MDNRTNTIAGWVLGAGIIALGASIVTGELFHGERPETMGYPIEGVVEEGAGAAEAEKPIAFYLASADAAAGAQVFKKCAACHTINQGGANGVGPNLWASMGKPMAHVPGFPYSDALKSKGLSWDWETMNHWVQSPKELVPGTKMTFAGLSKPEDRANLLAYLNSQGSNLPVPPPPAAEGNPAEIAAEEADAPAAGDKATDVPVPTEAQAAKQPEGNVGGEGAPAVTGTSKQERH